MSANAKNYLLPNKAENYLVFEESSEVSISPISPWSSEDYLTITSTPAHEDNVDEVFTDSERSDIISAYTPQELRERLLAMVSARSFVKEVPDHKTRMIIEDMLLEAEEYGIITDRHSEGLRIIFGQTFISSFRWLAEQSLLEDHPGTSTRIGRWLRRSADDRAESTLDRVQDELKKGSILEFGTEKVLNYDYTNDKVFYLFLPAALPQKNQETHGRLLKRVEAWGENAAMTAIKGMLTFRFGQLDNIRDYMTEVLGYDLDNSPNLGELVLNILKTSIESPGRFVEDHLEGFNELQELDHMRQISPSAQKVFNDRIVSFLKYVSYLHTQRKKHLSKRGVDTARDETILELSEIGGFGPLRKVCTIIARELEANTHISEESIERISYHLSKMNHDLHNADGHEATQKTIITKVKILLMQEGVVFDSNIFDKLLYEDS